MKEYYFREITSTQDYAKKISLDGEKDFVVFSDVQTNGHGRVGRIWKAPLGGLWFSFDNEFVDKNGLFTIAVGVAARKVLARIYSCKVLLKWPNDLIFENKKVGGILCEKVKERVIVGIGINTNTKNITEEKAITFFEKTGKVVDNYGIMNEIIKECKRCLGLKSEELIKEFRENMAYVGEEHFVSALNRNAKIIDVSDDGRLIVETDEGIKQVLAGEISECI